MKKLAIALLATVSGSAFAGVTETTTFLESVATSCGIELVSGKGGVGFTDRDPKGSTRIKIFSTAPDTTLRLTAVKHNIDDSILSFYVGYQVKGKDTIFYNNYETPITPVNNIWDEEVYVYLDVSADSMKSRDLFVDTVIQVNCTET